jgi:GT2 family glycosyltransferase
MVRQLFMRSSIFEELFVTPDTCRTDLPWVRIIIVNYNSGCLLQDCVLSLVGQSTGDFECVVVDNCSSDGSADRLQLPDDRFRLLRSDANLGFAAGSNFGARGAQTPWLATLNPDTRAHPDWLAHLRTATQRYPDITMFGSIQLNAADTQMLDGCGDVLSIYGLSWRGGYGSPAANAPPWDGEVFSPCAAAALYWRAA